MEQEIALIHHGMRHLPTGVQHGMGIELGLQKSMLQSLVQRDPPTKIVAFGLRQAGTQHAPGGGVHALDPVHAQPPLRAGEAGGNLQATRASGIPGLRTGRRPHMENARAPRAIAHREDPHRRRCARPGLQRGAQRIEQRLPCNGFLRHTLSCPVDLEKPSIAARRPKSTAPEGAVRQAARPPPGSHHACGFFCVISCATWLTSLEPGSSCSSEVLDVSTGALAGAAECDVPWPEEDEPALPLGADAPC